MAGLVFAQVCAADDAGKNFLPVPGEVTATQPVWLAAPAVKTNAPTDLNAPTAEMRKRAAATAASKPADDWAAYSRDRYTNLLLDGKLVDKSALTPLVGFLVKEQASLTSGAQTFTGAAFDIAKRKPAATKIAAAMELRPSLWTNTNERVFLLNYKPISLPGALMRIYVQEVAPLEGWRTFKTGVEPSFEDWKRLAGR